MSELKKEVKRVPNPAGKGGFKDNPQNAVHGRVKGRLDFHTYFRKFIDRLGIEEGKNPEDIEYEVFKKAISQMKRGDYNFYRDTQDRRFGKPTQPLEHGIDEDFKEMMEKINKLIP